MSAFPLEKDNPEDDDLPQIASMPILIFPDINERNKFWLNPIRQQDPECIEIQSQGQESSKEYRATIQFAAEKGSISRIEAMGISDDGHVLAVAGERCLQVFSFQYEDMFDPPDWGERQKDWKWKKVKIHETLHAPERLGLGNEQPFRVLNKRVAFSHDPDPKKQKYKNLDSVKLEGRKDLIGVAYCSYRQVNPAKVNPVNCIDVFQFAYG